MAKAKVKDKLRYHCEHCGMDRVRFPSVLKLSGVRHYKLMARILARCPQCQTYLYENFRKETGYCEICLRQIKIHPKCGTCGQLLGQEHGCLPIELYGKTVCYQCKVNWGRVKQRIGELDIERIVFDLWLRGKFWCYEFNQKGKACE